VTVEDTKATSTCQLYIQEDAALERPDEEAVLPSFVTQLKDMEVEDGQETCLEVQVRF